MYTHACTHPITNVQCLTYGHTHTYIEGDGHKQTNTYTHTYILKCIHKDTGTHT